MDKIDSEKLTEVDNKTWCAAENETQILEFRFSLCCPVCNHGKILFDRRTDLNFSVQCPKCGHFYKGNPATLKTQPSKALRGLRK